MNDKLDQVARAVQREGFLNVTQIQVPDADTWRRDLRDLVDAEIENELRSSRSVGVLIIREVPR